MSEIPYGTAEHAFIEHEHRELGPGLNRIHDVACAAGSLAAPDVSMALLGVLDWIETVLEPHAGWEDNWLYPEIDELAGTPWATKLMHFEHLQIRAIAKALEADWDLLTRAGGGARIEELRGRLFALEAVVRAHMEREERFLIPLLEVDRRANRQAIALVPTTG